MALAIPSLILKRLHAYGSLTNTDEGVVDRDILIQQSRVEPDASYCHANVSNVGTILSGASNNGTHSANGVTALFMATCRDVAIVSESSTSKLHTGIMPEGCLYISITVPFLIVANYGSGTGLATQQECLQVMGCAGAGNVNKFAEFVAVVALAVELSLGSAISSFDWVSSIERYGQNR